MGELAALCCALLWAITTVVMRAQSDRIPLLGLNAIRAGYSSVVYLAALAALGLLDDVARIPAAALGGLLGSVLVGMALGDTLHVRAMKLIGVSRALPISSTYPILTAGIAVIWLDEPLTLWVVGGILLVVAGVFLVAFPRALTRAREPAPLASQGVALAVIAAFCWAFSTAIVKPALDHVDPIVANGIRLPAALLVLAALALWREGAVNPFSYGRRNTFALLGLGITGGFSGALFLVSVHEAGAAKAAALSSTAPIFAAPMAALFLGERLSGQVAVGTLLTVAGIWLVL